MNRYLTVCQLHQSVQHIPYLSPFPFPQSSRLAEIEMEFGSFFFFFLQVNTQIFLDNETGKGGASFKHGADWRSVFLEEWENPSAFFSFADDSFQSYSNMSKKMD